MSEKAEGRKDKRPPGVCIPWQEKLKELPEISGDRELVQRIWEDVDALGYVYIWQCLLSF
jgi:hypothetical protein